MEVKSLVAKDVDVAGVIHGGLWTMLRMLEMSSRNRRPDGDSV